MRPWHCLLRGTGTASFLALLMLSATASGMAQDGTTDKAGAWRDWAAPDFVFADQFASPSEQQTYVAALKLLADPFRRAKVLNPPVGFVVRPQVGIRGSLDERKRKGPIPGQLFLQFFHYVRSCPTCEVKPTGEAVVEYMVVANSIDTLCGDNDQVASDAAGAIYLRPRRGVELAGYPRFERGTLITNITRPPFVPVSRERLFKALIAQESARNPEFAQALEIRFKKLTSDERAAQAMDGDWLGDELGSLGETARPVVATNPAFFSSSAPRTAIQALVIRGSGEHSQVPIDYMQGVVEAVWATVDWKAFSAMLTK